MPITAPVASNSGPPELPGLMEASIWMALVTTRSEDACVWSCEVESSSMETSDGAVERGNDAGRDRVRQAQRRTDRHDGRADLQALRRGETRDRQVRRRVLQADDRQVGGLVMADDARTVETSVRQGDLDLPRR